MGMLSPDSKCFSFDHRGNGYGRGEGIAALILKRLPDAIRDGDTIRAVIRSVGTNQDVSQISTYPFALVKFYNLLEFYYCLMVNSIAYRFSICLFPLAFPSI